MITIIHGDNIAESRSYFFEQKKNLPNLKTLEGSDLSIDKLADEFLGINLFFEEKNIAIEGFLSKTKVIKNFEDLVDFLNKNSKNSNLILWEEKEIGKRTLDKFKNADIKTFKIPKIIFNFLDAIKPGNGRLLAELFHKLLENNPTEIIVFMLIRQFRLMLGVQSHSSIDEISKMMAWQKGKITSQANLFGKAKLLELYSKLYEIDSKQKTGKLNVPVVSAIDIFLLSI